LKPSERSIAGNFDLTESISRDHIVEIKKKKTAQNGSKISEKTFEDAKWEPFKRKFGLLQEQDRI